MKIKSFEDACKALNIPDTVPPFPVESGAAAFYKLEIIARALNEGWAPDWNNHDQYKYCPWFGFQAGRFVFLVVHYYFALSCLGSRLCFRDEKTAQCAGETFIDLYREMFHPAENDFSDLL